MLDCHLVPEALKSFAFRKVKTDLWFNLSLNYAYVSDINKASAFVYCRL